MEEEEGQEVWSGLLITHMTMHELETVSDEFRDIVKKGEDRSKGQVFKMNSNNYLNIYTTTSVHPWHLYSKLANIQISSTSTVHVSIFQLYNYYYYIHLQVASRPDRFASDTQSTISEQIKTNRSIRTLHVSSEAEPGRLRSVKRFLKNIKKGTHLFLKWWMN